MCNQVGNITICSGIGFSPDDPILTMQCQICLQFADQQIGYIGTRCASCGKTDGTTYYHELANARRNFLGLTRKQMSELTGYSPKTIKNYEFGQCTKAYFDKTAEVVNKFQHNKRLDEHTSNQVNSPHGSSNIKQNKS